MFFVIFVVRKGICYLMAKKTIGITGMAGFVGSHLRDRLAREKDFELLPYDDSFYENPDAFIEFARNANVIVHLAGVNRDEPEVVYQKNIELMEKLLACADAAQSTPYIIFSSSTQIDRDNEYGRGKKRAMELLEQWSNTPRMLPLFRWLSRMCSATAAGRSIIQLLRPSVIRSPMGRSRPSCRTAR